MGSDRIIIAFLKKASLIAAEWFVGCSVNLSNMSHRIWIRNVLV
jgi:hypothetical protein